MPHDAKPIEFIISPAMRTPLVSPLKFGMHTAASTNINIAITQSKAGIIFSVRRKSAFPLFLIRDDAVIAETPMSINMIAKHSETIFSAARLPAKNGEMPFVSAPITENTPARV